MGLPTYPTYPTFLWGPCAREGWCFKTYFLFYQNRLDRLDRLVKRLLSGRLRMPYLKN
jgi:uncharacterized integral membrane protein